MHQKEGTQGKLGRKGDPRMHRAVAARLRNPDISLLDALIEGGFDFPVEGGHDVTLKDAEGVSLGQRKNQLSRRLRQARQQPSLEEINNMPNHEIVPRMASMIPGSLVDQLSENAVTMPGSVIAIDVSGKRGLKRDASAALVDQDDDIDMTDEMANADRIAKYHPQFQSLFTSARTTSSGGVYHPAANPQMITQGFGAGSGGIHGNNNIAVASLISTANSVGMTLEQFAMSLSNSPTLFQVLSSNPDPTEKLTLAVSLYRTDARALLQKCMLLAGYEHSEIMEGNAKYQQVALKVWEAEGKRLEILLGCPTGDQNQRPGEFCDCLPGVGPSVMANYGESQHPHSDSASDTPATNMMTKDQENQSFMNCSSSGDSGGRHLHRLSGKCGHKPIIHQPPGRPAHIDFVVDGKIECYEGIKPVGPKGQGAMWPSRYKCSDLACPTDPVKQSVTCGSDACGDESFTHNGETNSHPKQLSLNDVDFDGKEWNVDFFSYDGQDDTLMGLIKLGDGDK